MSSRLILKTKAHQLQYVIHFKPFSCFKHCNTWIYGILIFEALKKNKSMAEIYSLMVLVCASPTKDLC